MAMQGRPSPKKHSTCVPNHTVSIKSDFGVTTDSDGVFGLNLIQEAHGKQFSMRKYAFRIQELCPN